MKQLWDWHWGSHQCWLYCQDSKKNTCASIDPWNMGGTVIICDSIKISKSHDISTVHQQNSFHHGVSMTFQCHLCSNVPLLSRGSWPSISATSECGELRCSIQRERQAAAVVTECQTKFDQKHRRFDQQKCTNTGHFSSALYVPHSIDWLIINVHLKWMGYRLYRHNGWLIIILPINLKCIFWEYRHSHVKEC